MEIDLLHWFGFDSLLNPGKRLFWGYLLLSLFIVALYARFTGKSFRSFFSRAIWWHPSSRLDYGYFIVSSVIKLSLILPLVIGVKEIAFWIISFAEQWFGYQQKLNINHSLLIISYTLCLFLVSDFTRYWLHRLMHQIPWLWEIHKVHHSAEVLTPITFYRVHPLENLLFGFRYALSAGVVTGVFVYFFGAALQVMEILGVNVFVLAAHVVGDNLRHSHVRLAYPQWLERVLISPSQHQYHHTVGGSRSNYGGVLALWDYLFASLKLSNSQQKYVFGLEDASQYHSISQLLFLPLIRIIQSLMKPFSFMQKKLFIDNLKT